MDAATHALVKALHGAGRFQYVLAVTGGGSGVAAKLLNVPGGSRTLLEVIVPYHPQAFREFLGRQPDQFCSAETSHLMATRALERARWLAPGQAAAGVGCTASLATDRPKHGDHRAHFSLCTEDSSQTFSIHFVKDARDRAGEEAVLDALLLNALAALNGVAERLPVDLLPEERLEETGSTGNQLTATEQPLCVAEDGQIQTAAPPPGAVLPGSFNPLHQGHRELARLAAEMLGVPVAFELSIHNVDKGRMPPEEVRRRLRQFHWLTPVWVTTAATFVEKARWFAGATFVLGADTALRLLEPRYYAEGERGLATAFAFLRQQGCRFLVACRVDAGGHCWQLDAIHVPEPWRDLFRAIPPERFRLDVTSTQIRQQSRHVSP